MKFSDLLFEDATSEYNRSLKLLQKYYPENNKVDELLSKTVEVTNQSIDENPNRKIFVTYQNNKKLFNLTQLLISSNNINVFIATLEEYLQRDLAITDPIEKFKDYNEWEQKVHQARPKKQAVKKNLSDLVPVYDDEYVKVYLGEDADVCELLGSQHDYCISTGNSKYEYFRQYRYVYKQSTYFVFFKEQPSKTYVNNDDKLILIDALEEDDEKFTWNPTDKDTKQRDYPTTKTELLNKFPELQKAFDENVFVFREFSEKERITFEIIYNARKVNELKELEHIKIYGQVKNYKTEEWKYLKGYLNKEEFNEVLSMMIETTKYEIPDEYMTKNIIKKRYLYVRKRQLESILENRGTMEQIHIKLFKEDEELYNTWKEKIRQENEPLRQEILQRCENGVYDDNLDLSEKCYLFLPDLSDIEIKWTFSCSDNNLISLEGCPKKVYSFRCSYNGNLTNLKGCPKNVTHNFSCSNNNLINLDGCPEKLNGNFDCSYNSSLISLKGCPEHIRGNFRCVGNPSLTSLHGCEHITVIGLFACYTNENLKNLKGCPKDARSYDFSYNSSLTSLEGCPQEIKGYFDCSNNQSLTSLEGCPHTIGGYFYCYNTSLTSLEGCPHTVKGEFYYESSKLTEEDRLTAMENRRKKEEGLNESFKTYFYHFIKG